MLILCLPDYENGIRQMFLTDNNKSADLDQPINQSINQFIYVNTWDGVAPPDAHE